MATQENVKSRGQSSTATQVSTVADRLAARKASRDAAVAARGGRDLTVDESSAIQRLRLVASACKSAVRAIENGKGEKASRILSGAVSDLNTASYLLT